MCNLCLLCFLELLFCNLNHFDLNLVFCDYSVNKDPKHVCKRLRCFIISVNSKKDMTLIKTPISRSHLKKIINKEADLDKLLDIKGKQNVSTAVKLLNLIKESTFQSADDIVFSNHLERDVYNEYQLLAELASLFLSIFTNPLIDLFEQLCNLAILSHLLLFIFRRNKTDFITNSLYLDFQSIIQDAFVCVAKHKQQTSKEPLFLFQLGTDQLENLFSGVRTTNHSPNFNLLELSDRVKHSIQVENVYHNHPNWRAKSRLQSNTLDYSSVSSWIGDHSTENLKLNQIWKSGFREAKRILKTYDFNETEFNIDESITISAPFGSDINNDDHEQEDTNILEIENEINSVVNQNEIEDVDDCEAQTLSEVIDHSLNENKKNNFIETDKGLIHKSHAINVFLNKKIKCSKDRLLRVRCREANDLK